jgi:hypothetical protein
MLQVGDQPWLYYNARSTNHQDINLLLKYTHIQGYMFQVHRAIIRPLPKNRSISDFFLYNWDPKSLQC